VTNLTEPSGRGRLTRVYHGAVRFDRYDASHQRPEFEIPEFEEIVRALHTDVWLLCAHLTDRQLADDVTQETFLRVYKALSGFRGEASTKTWVLAIARRACADAIRARDRDRRRHQRILAEAAADSHEAPDIGGAVALWSLLDTLDVDRRAAFILTQLFGMTYEEAAVVCECPIGTIRSRVARARTDLMNAQGDPDVRPITSSAPGS